MEWYIRQGSLEYIIATLHTHTHTYRGWHSDVIIITSKHLYYLSHHVKVNISMCY